MLKKETGQSSFFGDMIYDRLFRKRSHWLKELLDVIDFSFINDLCQDLYESSTGRPAWSPEKLFKVDLFRSKENRAILAAVGIKNGIIPRKRRRDRPPTSRSIRPAIERKFAEMKRFHGLAKARYWGLAKVTIQCLMTAIVVNCKRLVTLIRQAAIAPIPNRRPI